MDPHSIFQTLYLHYHYVCRALQSCGVPSRDAADIAHDVYLRVYQRISAYDPARPPKPWLYGFVVRVAGDYRRAHIDRASGAPREVLSAGDFAATVPSAEQSVFHHQMLERITAALDRLELNLRRVLVLHDVEQMTMPAIASALGLPLNTGYTWLRRARAKLKRQISGRPARKALPVE